MSDSVYTVNSNDTNTIGNGVTLNAELAKTEPATQEPAKTEPAKPDTSAYDSIIEQQTKQIEALIKQNENLTAQVTKMIETGAQIRDEGAGETRSSQGNTGENYHEPTQMDENDDYSMAYLAKFMSSKH